MHEGRGEAVLHRSQRCAAGPVHFLSCRAGKPGFYVVAEIGIVILLQTPPLCVGAVCTGHFCALS